MVRHGVQLKGQTYSNSQKLTMQWDHTVNEGLWEPVHQISEHMTKHMSFINDVY